MSVHFNHNLLWPVLLVNLCIQDLFRPFNLQTRYISSYFKLMIEFNVHISYFNWNCIKLIWHEKTKIIREKKHHTNFCCLLLKCFKSLHDLYSDGGGIVLKQNCWNSDLRLILIGNLKKMDSTHPYFWGLENFSVRKEVLTSLICWAWQEHISRYTPL